MKLYIKIGDMYLQALYVNVTCSNTEFISSLEFCSDRSDIMTSATFDSEQKATSVMIKLATIFNIERSDIFVISEKSDSNE